MTVDVVRLSHDGLDRRYLLFRPPVEAARLPVVIFLPGTGGTAEWSADETRLPPFAAANGFLLVVPEALCPYPDQVPKFLSNPPRWNDGSHAASEELQTSADDVGFLAAVIADVLARTSADPHRVYLTGFSNGAGMTFRFAAERSDLVAAIAPIAGHAWDTPKPRRPVPTLYVVGTLDPLVPYRGGSVELPWGNKLHARPPVLTTLERWADANACRRLSQVESEAGGVREEVFPGPVEVRAITVVGLGHHWPGGKGQLNPRIGGPTTTLLDANARLWDFFGRHEG